MIPVIKIVADSQDITDRIRDRLLSLRLTDEAGTTSDTVEIQLDDRDSKIEWPTHGAELEVFLGFSHTEMVRMGLFTVDEIEQTGPPSTLTVRGKAADMRASFKASKTRSWDNVTLGALVSQIANENGLTAKVAEVFTSTTITHLDQTDESDLHLLTRLAREFGAVAKPVAGYLVFAQKGEAKSVSGMELPTVDINVVSVQQHRMTQAERGKYQSVRAYWHETESADQKSVIIGSGEPVYSMRHSYPSNNEATRAATAKLQALTRGVETLSLTVIGNAELQAEGKLNLSNLRDAVNGEWLLKRVEHQFDAQGFVTRIEAETPNS